MKLVNPNFCTRLSLEQGRPFTLVIENRTLFRRFVEDLYLQVSGGSGESVISRDNLPLKPKDCVDIIDSFAPFDINTKAVISALSDEICGISLNADHYMKTCELMSTLGGYINELCFEMPFSVECRKLDIRSIVKAASISVVDDYVSPLEKIADYMAIRRDLDRISLFVTVNMSAYFEPSELDAFMKLVSQKDLSLLMIESFDRSLPAGMPKLVIDADLCEF